MIFKRCFPSQITAWFYSLKSLRMARPTPEMIICNFRIDVVVQILFLFSLIIVFNLVPCPHQVWAAFNSSVTGFVMCWDSDDPFSDVDFLGAMPGSSKKKNGQSKMKMRMLFSWKWKVRRKPKHNIRGINFFSISKIKVLYIHEQFLIHQAGCLLMFGKDTDTMQISFFGLLQLIIELGWTALGWKDRTEFI